MIHYECCDICPERKIGISCIDGLVFCEDCGKRELEHNIRIGERVIKKHRELEK